MPPISHARIALTAFAVLSYPTLARADIHAVASHEALTTVTGRSSLRYHAMVPPPSTMHWRGASRTNTVQVVDALVVSVAATEVLKRAIRERRPDSSAHDSFPSRQTTAAFAVAAVQSHHHPRQTWLWYAGASAIGISRVTSNRHYAHDVLAGAALGYVIGRNSLTRHNRAALVPEFSPEHHMIGLGLHLEF